VGSDDDIMELSGCWSDISDVEAEAFIRMIREKWKEWKSPGGTNDGVPGKPSALG